MNKNCRMIFSLEPDKKEFITLAAGLLKCSEGDCVRLMVNRGLEQIIEIYRDEMDLTVRELFEKELRTHFQYGKKKGKIKKRFPSNLSQSAKNLLTERILKQFNESKLCFKRRRSFGKRKLNFKGSYEDVAMAKSVLKISSENEQKKGLSLLSLMGDFYFKIRVKVEQKGWEKLEEFRKEKISRLRMLFKRTMPLRKELKIINRAIKILEKGEKISIEDFNKNNSIEFERIRKVINERNSEEILKELYYQKALYLLSINVQKEVRPEFTREKNLWRNNYEVWNDPLKLAEDRQYREKISVLHPAEAGHQYDMETGFDSNLSPWDAAKEFKQDASPLYCDEYQGVVRRMFSKKNSWW